MMRKWKGGPKQVKDQTKKEARCAKVKRILRALFAAALAESGGDESTEEEHSTDEDDSTDNPEDADISEEESSEEEDSA